MKEFLPFALPDLGEEEIAEVVDSLRSGWLTTGPKTAQFERDFAEFIGSGVEAIAVNSGTSGLHLALEAAGVREGDQVIVPAYTFTATAEVVRYLGGHPVFVDIDPMTLNIEPDQIEAALTPRTKAIIPVHFAGLACDMDRIIRIAENSNLKIIEDAAHALPATREGRLIGTLQTDATVFSFYATKTIATGEGGMVVTRNNEFARRCRVMRLHGIDRDAFDRYTAKRASWYYEIIAPGFKYNLPDVLASLGIHQLKKARRFHEIRSKMAAEYDRALSELPVNLPPRPAGGDMHAWHLYVLRLAENASVSRDKFIDEMFARGIGCSVHFIPLHLQPYWRDTYRLKPEDFPNALACYRQAVSIPLYTKMTDSDQDRVIQAITEILT